MVSVDLQSADGERGICNPLVSAVGLQIRPNYEIGKN